MMVEYHVKYVKASNAWKVSLIVPGFNYQVPMFQCGARLQAIAYATSLAKEQYESFGFSCRVTGFSEDSTRSYVLTYGTPD